MELPASSSLGYLFCLCAYNFTFTGGTQLNSERISELRRKEEDWWQVIFCKQVLSSDRRNAARSVATPEVTASANQSSPGQSRHTGQACRASLAPAVVTAEICCTIAGKA